MGELDPDRFVWGELDPDPGPWGLDPNRSAAKGDRGELDPDRSLFGVSLKLPKGGTQFAKGRALTPELAKGGLRLPGFIGGLSREMGW